MIFNVLVSTEDPENFAPMLDILSNDRRFSFDVIQGLQDAVLFMLDSDIDLTVLDMDGRTNAGLKTLEIFQKIRPAIPVIVVSSSDVFQETGAAAMENGAFYCLIKPLRKETVMEVVDSAINGGNGKLIRQNSFIKSRDRDDAQYMSEKSLQKGGTG